MGPGGANLANNHLIFGIYIEAKPSPSNDLLLLSPPNFWTFHRPLTKYEFGKTISRKRSLMQLRPNKTGKEIIFPKHTLTTSCHGFTNSKFRILTPNVSLFTKIVLPNKKKHPTVLGV